jgi:hypothetical protein
METLSSFARTQGAKDKQERKKRNVYGYLGGGGVLGVGGLTGAKHFTKKYRIAVDKAFDEIIEKGIPQNTTVIDFDPKIGRKYGVYKNRNLAYGALGVGALGAGLVAKGVYNDIRNIQQQ